MMQKPFKILDSCCGPKLFWFNKNNPDVVFMDRRIEKKGFIKQRLNRSVAPDVKADFRNIPFKDESFDLVIMDPPHLTRGGPLFNLIQNYGKLDIDNWFHDIRSGFKECMRVLKTNGTLIFKWNENQIKKTEVMKAIKFKPLLGIPITSNNKTHFIIFCKNEIQ